MKDMDAKWNEQTQSGTYSDKIHWGEMKINKPLMIESIDHLLTPRYEVIADYPGCPYPVGEILIVSKGGELYSETCGYSFSALKIMVNEAHKFTHLVRKLAWWEHRKPEEMEAVKYLRYGPTDARHTIYEVGEWNLSPDALHSNLYGAFSKQNPDYFLPLSLSQNVWPATESDYLNYQNSLK